MMPERKARIWLVSLAFGLASSILVASIAKTGLAYWLPPFWPGLFLAVTFEAFRGQRWTPGADFVLIIAGNAAFYTWIFSRIVRAEIAARGHLSRYFVRG
jgi:hypothetical protein